MENARPAYLNENVGSAAIKENETNSHFNSNLNGSANKVPEKEEPI